MHGAFANIKKEKQKIAYCVVARIHLCCDEIVLRCLCAVSPLFFFNSHSVQQMASLLRSLEILVSTIPASQWASLKKQQIAL